MHVEKVVAEHNGQGAKRVSASILDGSSFGASLLSDIDQFAAQVRTCKLYQLTAEGCLPVQVVADYVANLCFLTRHAPKHLSLAERSAARQGKDELAQYYAGKFVEEHGHDRWAEQDLQGLKERFGVVPGQVPASAMRQLVEHLEESIERDVEEYMPYLLFAEYLVVAVGPEWMNMLAERCGVERGLVTILGNHIVLDVRHATEGVGEIDRLLTDRSRWPALRARLRVFMSLLGAFFDELVAVRSGDASLA